MLNCSAIESQPQETTIHNAFCVIYHHTHTWEGMTRVNHYIAVVEYFVSCHEPRQRIASRWNFRGDLPFPCLPLSFLQMPKEAVLHIYIPWQWCLWSCRGEIGGRCGRGCKVQRAEYRQQLSPGGTARRPCLESGPARTDPTHGTEQVPCGSVYEKKLSTIQDDYKRKMIGNKYVVKRK